MKEKLTKRDLAELAKREGLAKLAEKMLIPGLFHPNSSMRLVYNILLGMEIRISKLELRLRDKEKK